PDVELDSAQDRPQRCPAELALQAGKRLGDVNARGQVCGELPTELRELPRADPAKQDAFPPGWATSRPLEVFGERVERFRFLGRSRLVAPVRASRIRLKRRVLRIRAGRPRIRRGF